MNIRVNKISSQILLTVVLSVPFIQGCTTEGDRVVNEMSTAQQIKLVEAGDDKQFNDWYNQLLTQIKADSNYKRMPIDTKRQELESYVWFHEAYRKQITKEELARRLNTSYPNHKYEVNFIVSRLP
ncbi:hypothetical protein [Advenella mimigardefordensis]|uniref:Putative lipoprotein n=1 Tax=Advenella mimigardefordensis (strain DSM 17166 / LMG 22922 / DPN7) TaxID=1247726 RepID=W0PK71_ADVMD|nr:hypothetical protein [Advenella mimigardefordensis]AHG65388.1 putative lipoprotein [Advenella mimigardefordensis DPN7]